MLESDHWKIYDSSAGFDLKFPIEICRLRCKNFKSAALAGRTVRINHW
jgi:hypothetical protein